MQIVISIVLTAFFLFVGSRYPHRVLQDPDFLPDSIFTTIIIFFSLRYLSWLNLFLNKRYGWQRPITKRLLLQLAFGTVFPSTLIWVSVYCYRAFVLHMPDLEMAYFNANEFPVGVLVAIFFNLTYVGYSFYIESREKGHALHALQQELFTLQNIRQEAHSAVTIEANDVQQQEEVEVGKIKSPVKLLIAYSGNKNIPLLVEDVAYIYKQGMYIQLKTFKNETYLLNHSLEEVMQLLGDGLFFRANRQFIINIKSCQFFTNEENGKLALHLLPAYKEEDIIISQKRASAFKEWLNR